MPDLLERLRSALADRYAVESEIGRGGMATVFLAEDLRHERKVAVKVLHPELAATLGTARFLSEIKIAASLNHPHILPLFDSGEAAGLLYYVMPFVEGESLQERLEGEGQLPIDQAVAIAAEVAEGLDYAHRQGVIHRDIKPGNILLSEGHALIADFGVARAIGAASEIDSAAFGLAVGTPKYMSPEQATSGADVDGRSDVYALGCVLWEMLAGEPPFGGLTPQAIMARKAIEEAPDVRAIRGRVPEALEECLEGALAPQPPDRFSAAGELATALREAILLGVTPQAVARKKRRQRRRTMLLGLAVIAVVGAALAFKARADGRQVEWARTEGLEAIRRLAHAGRYDSALVVATRVEMLIPQDSMLNALWGLISATMTIETDPPGARVYRRKYGSDEEVPWRLVGVTPIDSVRIPLEYTHWRLELNGYTVREHITLPWWTPRRARKLLAPGDTVSGMVPVGGYSFDPDWFGLPERFSIGDYLLDRYETTNRQYAAFVQEGGYENREYWVEPFVLDGRVVPWEQAIGLLVDATGQPGPSTWVGGAYPAGQEDFPVGGISWYEAAAYAEYTGKSLPTVFHLDAAMEDLLDPVVIPRSNVGPTEGPVAVGSRQSLGDFMTYDQYGNVREWTFNARDDGKVAFGGSWGDTDHRILDWEWQTVSAWDRSGVNGVRLAIYSDTSGVSIAKRAMAPESPGNDSPSVLDRRPVSESVYDSLVRRYDYDAALLEPTIERIDTLLGWPVERVSFTGPDGSTRMGAYVFLPRHGQPPFQSVLFMLGYAAEMRSFAREYLLLFDSFLERGRAVVLPILTGTYQPYDPASLVLDNRYWQPPEIVIQWARELRRTIDYLETRSDIDKERIAFYGMYFGAIHAPIFTAIEPRIRVAFVESGALVSDSSWPPEVDPFHFLPRVRTPILIIHSRYGRDFTYEDSQLPMLELLGTPQEHKRLVSGPFHWPIMTHEIVAEVGPWFDEYLGPVEGF